MIYYIIILSISILCFILGISPDEIGYSQTNSSIVYHLFYLFGSASWVHLLNNSVALLVSGWFIGKVFNTRQIVIRSFIFSFLASYICAYDLPVVGLSAFIYAMIGSMHLYMIQSGRTNAGLWTSIIVVLSINLVVSMISEHVATRLHIVSYLLALALSTNNFRHILHK